MSNTTPHTHACTQHTHTHKENIHRHILHFFLFNIFILQFFPLVSITALFFFLFPDLSFFFCLFPCVFICISSDGSRVECVVLLTMTFASYFDNYFLFWQNVFATFLSFRAAFSSQIGENNHFNFSLSNHFLPSSCFSFVCFVFRLSFILSNWRKPQGCGNDF